ncbi:stage III sporulation protein AA [Desulfosporosinus orientis DSM 765]|uniref:Stage III sporulation protein AA n=1 Tax=Desulfosporosinus orientis (strain ATCC 19365 / DSM 765 / NCIMB 8382 / VKM B-1628 / Singapore I) TaxID=768706 RepID=G7W851_DESOD|nr:stage III sporulation protein AA [Desulfosporosinus orientis]AET66697.1 stage III sporulation protein AA [Desulfosporosinus orientis DSM 765]
MSLHYTLSVAQTPKVIPNNTTKVFQNEKRLPVQQSADLWADMARWFGDDIRSILANLKDVAFHETEELRLRAGQPFQIRTLAKDLFINKEGEATSPQKAYVVKHEDLVSALERMTQSSVYAAEEDFRQGFITLPGGNRVGITGKIILLHGNIQTIKHISSLNLRIARDISGLASKILPLLLSDDGNVRHTLIISPPRAGKTTFLRDLIRSISNGVPQIGLRGLTVGVVDERGELAGMWQGVPTYDLGLQTDIMDSCPKASGLSMLVRSMSPQVVAMDEIGHMDDVAAITDALRTGVRILCTAHASSFEEAHRRPAIAALLDQGVFERLVVLSRRLGPGSIEGVYDLNSGRILS